MLSVGFTCSVRVKGTHTKKVAVEQSAATLFVCAIVVITNYLALTFRKQKSFGTYADKNEA